MKKLFVTLALICAFIPTWAQFNYPTAAPMWFYLARMASPSFDTTTYGAASFPGIWQYRQQPGDTGYYFSNGRRFMKVATGNIDLSLYYTKSELQSAGDAIVNYGNVANIGAVKLLGRYSNSSGVAQEISLGSGLTLNTSTGVLTSDISTASNGLTLTGTDVRLGGTLNTTTTVNTGADNAFLVTKTDASNNVSRMQLGGSSPVYLMAQQIGTQRIGEIAIQNAGTLYLRSNNNGQPGQDARVTIDGTGVSTQGSFTLGTDDASVGTYKMLTRNNSTGRVETVAPSNQTITLSGDATGSGTSSIPVTLASVGTAGTYTKVTTDGKGRVTSGTTLSAADIPTLTAYIQNGTSTQSSSNFHISGVGQANTQFEVLKNGSSAAAPHYVLKDAGGTDRADLQLTEAATPGMSLWTAGSERMRIESDGDVGIGTTSPSSKLHVSGGPITAAQLQSASGGDLTLWGQGSSQNIIFSAGATSTELMRLTSGGNLGIGVTPAFGSIHIKKNAGAIDVQNTGAYGTNSGGWVYLLNSGTPSAADHKLGAFLFGSAPTDANPKIGAVIDASSDGATWTDGSSHPTYIRFQTVAAGSTALLEKMRILGNGNIVIGCVGCDNGSKLQVGGTTSTQKLIVFTPTAYDQTHTNQKIVRDGTTSELVSYSGDIADYVTLSSSITLGTAEYYIKSNSTAYTVIVPSASANAGRTYLIKNSGNTTNNVTVDVATNSQTIDGVNTNVSITPGTWIRIVSNGTAWFKVGG